MVPASNPFSSFCHRRHSTRPHSFLGCTAEHQSRPCTLATHSGYPVDALGVAVNTSGQPLPEVNMRKHVLLHMPTATPTEVSMLAVPSSAAQEVKDAISSNHPLPQQGPQILFGQVLRAPDPAACLSAYSCRGILDRKPSPARR